MSLLLSSRAFSRGLCHVGNLKSPIQLWNPPSALPRIRVVSSNKTVLVVQQEAVGGGAAAVGTYLMPQNLSGVSGFAIWFTHGMNEQGPWPLPFSSSSSSSRPTDGSALAGLVSEGGLASSPLSHLVLPTGPSDDHLVLTGTLGG